MTILLTGAAGFIGFHVANALLEQGEKVVGVDNLTDYYDISLKQARLEQLEAKKGFGLLKTDIADYEAFLGALNPYKDDITHIIHLAAQPGVRYSKEHPFSYQHSNLQGQLSVLELMRHLPNVEHLVSASSSSVYGGNDKVPFSESDSVDNPISLYAATKRGAELMNDTYVHQYAFPVTSLRFFTVYGPWGRPDMAYFFFTDYILNEKPITLFNEGLVSRDFTYIDDIVAGILAAKDNVPAKDGKPYHNIYNLGNHTPQTVHYLVTQLEAALGKQAIIEYAPLDISDMETTYADINKAQTELGFEPKTGISTGIPAFVDWYKSYFEV